jgi:hypothetical protein
MTGQRTSSGDELIQRWRIPAVQARYHKDGTWSMPLERFPGALCDPNGYVLFRDRADYEASPFLEIGKRMNTRGGRRGPGAAPAGRKRGPSVDAEGGEDASALSPPLT